MNLTRNLAYLNHAENTLIFTAAQPRKDISHATRDSTPDTGYSMPDTGCWMLDTGCLAVDTSGRAVKR